MERILVGLTVLGLLLVGVVAGIIKERIAALERRIDQVQGRMQIVEYVQNRQLCSSAARIVEGTGDSTLWDSLTYINAMDTLGRRSK